MRLIFLALAIVAVPAASSQIASSTPDAPPEPSLSQRVLDPERPTLTDRQPEGLSPAEAQVRAIIEQEGIHVVRFWAPWCGNSMNELRDGLYDLIGDHPDVTFTFVTVRNDGEDGQATLDRFAIPDRVTVLAEQNRQPLTFLGLPITWTPTTWIFNREGKLAYAFNYGEISPAMLTAAIAHARDDWHHD